ncbi:MAG: hypothetical protein LC802_00875 [Acidobacteria bacterium]|nr:hypothetical protein [Acidobacteriota bacterium]
MDFIIETVVSDEDESAMLDIRERVFEREMGIRLAPAHAPGEGGAAHLLARVAPGGEAVGTLSVIDTSGDRALHESCGLGFDPGERTARYMHLAVLKSYRGMKIPLKMMLAAHHRVVVPRGYGHTWLLFDAERAPAAPLFRLLGFELKQGVFVSEYGRRRPLVRDERAPSSEQVIRRAEQYLEGLNGSRARAGAQFAGAALGM